MFPKPPPGMAKDEACLCSLLRLASHSRPPAPDSAALADHGFERGQAAKGVRAGFSRFPLLAPGIPKKLCVVWMVMGGREKITQKID